MTHPPPSRKGGRYLGVIRRGQLVSKVLLLADMIRRHYRPRKTTPVQLAMLIMLETDCSRATAYRWAAEFRDALGLELAEARTKNTIRGS